MGAGEVLLVGVPPEPELEMLYSLCAEQSWGTLVFYAYVCFLVATPPTSLTDDD